MPWNGCHFQSCHPSMKHPQSLPLAARLLAFTRLPIGPPSYLYRCGYIRLPAWAEHRELPILILHRSRKTEIMPQHNVSSKAEVLVRATLEKALIHIVMAISELDVASR